MTIIDAAKADDIYEVALRMRERDYAEFSAVTPADTREKLADILASRYAGQDHVICARNDTKAVAIGSAVEMRPNVLSLLFYADDDFPSIADDLTRFIVKRLFPPLVTAGVHRIEAVALEGYTETHRWLGVLGLKPESPPLLNYGKGGEAFRMYSWVKDVRPAGA